MAHITSRVEASVFWWLPAWPWICMILVGAVSGYHWLDKSRQPNTLNKHLKNLNYVVLFCLGMYIAMNLVHGRIVNFNLQNDYIINSHWLPGSTTLFWMLAIVLGSFVLMQHVSKTAEVKLQWLVDLGQSALPLYVLHLLLIALIADRIIGFHISQWWVFILFNVLLLTMLVLSVKTLQSNRVRALLKP